MSDEQPTNEELDRLVERLGRDFTLSMYASRAHMEGDLEGQRRLAIMAINHLRAALAKRDASSCEARDAGFGTRLTVSEDGVWLHLQGPNHKAGICLSAHPIAHKWADDYVAMIEANKESK